jgi:hypothetical protein
VSSRQLIANRGGLILAVAIFLAALGLYAYSNVTGNTVARPTPSPLASPIVTLRAADVTSFQLKQNGRTFTGARQGPSAWTFSVCAGGQTPCQPQPADAAAMGVLLDAILELRPSISIPGAPAGMSAYALQTPTGGEIVVNASSGKVVDLYVGGKDPGSTYYYLRLASGNDVYAVPTTTIDGQIFKSLDSPPLPSPSPPAAPASAPASPAAGAPPAQPGAPPASP